MNGPSQGSMMQGEMEPRDISDSPQEEQSEGNGSGTLSSYLEQVNIEPSDCSSFGESLIPCGSISACIGDT